MTGLRPDPPIGRGFLNTEDTEKCGVPEGADPVGTAIPFPWYAFTSP